MGVSQRPGWVYFIKKDNLVKIGWSANPQQRVQKFEGDLLGLLPGPMTLEKELHKRFADLHQGSEWFRLGNTLRDWLDMQMLEHELPYVPPENRMRMPRSISNLHHYSLRLDPNVAQHLETTSSQTGMSTGVIMNALLMRGLSQQNADNLGINPEAYSFYQDVIDRLGGDIK